jgi:hypothetical protein
MSKKTELGDKLEALSHQRLHKENRRLDQENQAMSAKIHAAMNIVAKADQIMLDAVSWYDNYTGVIDHCPWIEAAREHVKFYNDEREVSSE